MVRFGYLSVTLSNAGHAKKCVSKYCTLLMAITINYGLKLLKGCLWLKKL